MLWPNVETLDYYHGRLDRLQAEKFLTHDGQFLLRYTVQRVNDNEQKLLVLSCQHRNQHLHFIIHEIITQDVGCRRFYFENKSFALVSDLISYYVINRIPITIESGAIIIEPIDCRLDCRMITAIQLNESNNNQSTSTSIINVLLEHDAEFLAKQLLKSNIRFIMNKCKVAGINESICSGLELMLLPEGTQLRKDLIIRHECLKYFVITTILKQTDQSKQLELIRKWMEIAERLENSIHDHFGFGSIMFGLCFPRIQDSTMWKIFGQKYGENIRIFENSLRFRFTNYLNNSRISSSSNTCLPFIIQLCHIIEYSHIVDTNFLPKFIDAKFDQSSLLEFDKQIGLNNFGLEDIIELTELSDQIIKNLEQFDHNFQSIIFRSTSKHQQVDTNVDQLFRTDFHVRFLFENKHQHRSINEKIKLNSEDFYRLESSLNDDHQFVGCMKSRNFIL
ncbi:breast cancer anti-estrogen resistance protein 3 homolog [Dermatophagoides pteronyssinus]|uniref:breast cancer anti-estrogen resistance protein 3 homolog n=1 Tax=Dermatophagoides pteronyssinus TaxID=6956 RepID=UPI003F6787A5